MQELADEFSDDGLVILAISDESPRKVGKYVESMGLDVRVAAGSKAGKEYGVRGFPTSVLIDPKGKIVWSGHPMRLSTKLVEQALDGAEPLADDEFMRVFFEGETPAALSAARKAAEAGKLGLALEKARAFQGGNGEAFVQRIEDHIALLEKQIDDCLEERRVAEATDVLSTLR